MLLAPLPKCSGVVLVLFTNSFLAKIKREAVRIILSGGSLVSAHKSQAAALCSVKTKRIAGVTGRRRPGLPLVRSGQEGKCGYFKFRPLTRNEKKKFMRALNPDAKRMLSELGSQAPITPGFPDLNSLDAARPRPRAQELTD